MKFKYILFIAILFATNSIFADTKIIKTCDTTLPSLEGQESIDLKIEIIKSNKETFAQITDENQSYKDIVKILNLNVREDISDDLESPEIDTYNMAESLITHAMFVTADPDLGKIFSAGFDLKKVRSAKLYVVGQETNIGSSTIVEAYDKSKKYLGSFLGGFLVTPCKKK